MCVFIKFGRGENYALLKVVSYLVSSVSFTLSVAGSRFSVVVV